MTNDQFKEDTDNFYLFTEKLYMLQFSVYEELHLIWIACKILF